MLRSALLGVCCSVVVSQATPKWFGFRPTEATPNSVDLVELDDHAVVSRVIGAVPLKEKGEYAWPNAVRCQPGPPGFCLLATSVFDDAGAAGNVSYVYRVSSTDASIIYRVECPGEARCSLHCDSTLVPGCTLQSARRHLLRHAC